MSAGGATYCTAFRLKLYPTDAHRLAMAQHAGASRWLWNHLLDLNQRTYSETGKFVFRSEMSKLLPGLKRDEATAWLAQVNAQTLQRIPKTLHEALKSFFAGRSEFPKFKKKGKSRTSFYVSNQALRIEPASDGRPTGRVRVAGIGSMRFRAGRLPEGRILGANVSYDGRSWWVAIQCVIEAKVEPGSAPITAETAMGGDLGLSSLVTLFDGKETVFVDAPRGLRKAQRKLRRAQRILSKRQKGSARRRRQARRVATLHRKVSDRRSNFHHALSAWIAASYALVCVEDLNVKGMAANRRLALSLADAALGELLRQIRYKVARNGGHVVTIGRFEPSTQVCSACGHRREGQEKMTLSDRIFRCVVDECGHVADRDANAAANIRRIGLAAVGVHVPYERANRVIKARRATPGGPAPMRRSMPDPGSGAGRSRNPMARVVGHIREPVEEVSTSRTG